MAIEHGVPYLSDRGSITPDGACLVESVDGLDDQIHDQVN